MVQKWFPNFSVPFRFYQPLRNVAQVATGISLFVGVQGCGLHPVSHDPGPEVAGFEAGAESDGFSNAPAGAKQRPMQSADWWQTFRQRELDQWIVRALQENPDVRAVGRRIEQANSRLVQAGATLFPQVNGATDVQRRWNVDGGADDDGSIGLVLDWELDVWGRIRSGRAAREQEVVAAREDWRAARLLLTGAVAEAWFELVEQQGQLSLAADQIEVNQVLLDLTRLRFGQGQSSRVAILQQQEQLQSIESLVPVIEARIEALSLSLETLTGRMPGSVARPFPAEDPGDPRSVPAVGYPADLLAERPDLRARRARIIALDHEVGEAIAGRLPRFSIGGSVAVAGTATPERLVGDLIGGVVGPVFDAGNRKAEVERRRSRLSEELDLYSAEFLEAVRDVETALILDTKQAQRVKRQEKQLATARKLLTESRNRFSQGLTDYLPVIDAVTKLQELERDLLTSRRERFSARIALHRALGGPLAESESGS